MNYSDYDRNNVTRGRKAGRLLLRTAASVIVLTLLFGLYLTGNSCAASETRVSIVLTGSMEPAFSAGDLIIISRSESYNEGDIVVFNDGTLPVVHRIVEIDGDTAVTKGDANNIADRPVRIADIKGRVTSTIPYLGLPILLLRTRSGMIGAAVLAFVLILLSFGGGKDNADELASLRAEAEQLRRQRNNDGTEE